MQVLKKAMRDVVRVRDVSSLIDISEVQQYVCNGYKVVYLKKWSSNKGSMFRPKLRYLRMSACVGCRRRLKSAYRFCSIGCKHVGSCFFSFQKNSYGLKLGDHFFESLLRRKRLQLTRHRMLGCPSAHSSWRMALNLAAHSIRS